MYLSASLRFSQMPQSRQTTSPIKTRKTGVPSRSDVSFILRIRTLCSILRFPFCQRFISTSTPLFFYRATAGCRTLPRSSGSHFTLTEYICSYVLCNTAHYITFFRFVHAESVFHMVKTGFFVTVCRVPVSGKHSLIQKKCSADVLYLLLPLRIPE